MSSGPCCSCCVRGGRGLRVMATPDTQNGPAQHALDSSWPLEFWPEPKFELEGMQYAWSFEQAQGAPADLAGAGDGHQHHAGGYFPPQRSGGHPSLGEMGVSLLPRLCAIGT